MILVFGGTTEGNQVISALASLDIKFVYSTKTKIKVDLPVNGIYRSGAMDQEILIDFIKDNNIQLIINAAHPFASDLHNTIANLMGILSVKVIRIERTLLQRVEHENIVYVDDYAKALNILLDQFAECKGLFFTGVQSIKEFKEFWKNNQSYFRIIKRATSLKIAQESGFPSENLILEEVKGLVGGEKKLVVDYQADFMVTKESGKNGALDEKIKLAIDKDITLIIIKRPSISEKFENISSFSDMLNYIKLNFQLKS